MHDTVAALYSTFSGYRIGGDFSGCDHCVSEVESRHLAATPLDQLTPQQLDRYAFKAMTTWGGPQHFKHFLPRLFELLLENVDAFDFTEVLIGKLRRAEWKQWPALEQNVVVAFLDHLWLSTLNVGGSFPGDDKCITLLGGFAQASPSIQRYLDVWCSGTTENAALHLGQAIQDTADEIIQTGTTKIFWGEPETAAQEFVQWLSTETPTKFLKANKDAVSKVFPSTFTMMEALVAAVSSYD
jgi:hypothetical protein